MSLSAWKWACTVEVQSHTAKAVLLHLANYANTEARAWPSQGRVATELHLSDRTVRAGLALLEKLGLITRIRRVRERGWGRTSDMIRLNLPDGAVDLLEAEDATGNRKQLPVASPRNRQETAKATGRKPPQATGSTFQGRTSTVNSQVNPPRPLAGAPAPRGGLPDPFTQSADRIELKEREPVETVEPKVSGKVEAAPAAEPGPVADGAGGAVEPQAGAVEGQAGKSTAVRISAGVNLKHGREAGKPVPCPLPDEWAPKPAHYAKAAARGYTAAFVDEVADAMRSWAQSEGHRKVTLKSNWDGTFHGFLRRDMADADRRRPRNDDRRPRNGYFVQLEAAAERLASSQALQSKLLGGPSDAAVAAYLDGEGGYASGRI